MSDGTTTFTFEGRVYAVNADEAIRALCVVLPDERILRVGSWTYTIPQGLRDLTLTSLRDQWTKLPELMVHVQRTAFPLYLVEWAGQVYEAQVIPWSFARVPNSDTVLEIVWKEDRVNWYAPESITEITEEEYINRLPRAVPVL